MESFHTTKCVYNVGDVIKVADYIGDYCNYHVNSDDSWINDFLDETKPTEEPPRRKCIYAFSLLSHCAAYIGQRKDSAEYNFYKVEINTQSAHPMCLTDVIRIASSIGIQTRLRNEYWYPTKKWKFNEFLGTEMIILEKIETVPPGFFLIQGDYSDDIKMANEAVI
ncbi:hypothetical protein LJC06_03265 [Bacteroidales bacterium OttesenSCG-928-I14]|nr:hypothetical protein [Bacteroidales bacterium OttesenSCG-928-I14]